jgi:hypothetical protein
MWRPQLLLALSGVSLFSDATPALLFHCQVHDQPSPVQEPGQREEALGSSFCGWSLMIDQ